MRCFPPLTHSFSPALSPALSLPLPLCLFSAPAANLCSANAPGSDRGRGCRHRRQHRWCVEMWHAKLNWIISVSRTSRYRCIKLVTDIENAPRTPHGGGPVIVLAKVSKQTLISQRRRWGTAAVSWRSHRLSVLGIDAICEAVFSNPPPPSPLLPTSRRLSAFSRLGDSSRAKGRVHVLLRRRKKTTRAVWSRNENTTAICCHHCRRLERLWSFWREPCE